MKKYDFKAWRVRLGLTQAKAAKKLGVSLRSYRYYEAEDRGGSWHKMLVMACKWIELQEK